MNPDEFLALVEKMRAAQRRPSVRRTFLSGPDRDACSAYEEAVDAELARRRERGGPCPDEQGGEP